MKGTLESIQRFRQNGRRNKHYEHYHSQRIGAFIEILSMQKETLITSSWIKISLAESLNNWHKFFRTTQQKSAINNYAKESKQLEHFYFKQ